MVLVVDAAASAVIRIVTYNDDDDDEVSGDIIVHPKASWTGLIWALYQVDNAQDY